jgi:hypothetical protein
LVAGVQASVDEVSLQRLRVLRENYLSQNRE